MIMNMRLSILFGLFIGLLVGMNLLGVKIVTLLGVSVSVGIFMMPLTFLITDIVEEVHGKNVTKQFVITGILVLLVTFLFTASFVSLAPHERFALNNDAYTTIFGASIRIMLASLIAFTISQAHDMWAFNFWKKKTNGKFLWLRNNFSTYISQAIDTFIFMMIAFYMETPRFDFAFIISLSIPYYLFKIVFATLDTPLVYLGVWWLKKAEK